MRLLQNTGLAAIALGLALAPAVLPARARAADPESVGGKVFSIGGRGTYVDPRDADQAKWYGGVQARLRIVPAIAIEGSVDYRRNLFGAGTTIARSYPVQLSLLAYLTPNHR